MHCFELSFLLFNTLLQLFVTIGAWRCKNTAHVEQLQFSLVKTCRRSQQAPLAVANVATLEDCIRVAKRVRGLALNYVSAQYKRHQPETERTTQFVHMKYGAARATIWHQPQEYFNCHVLACPENATLRGLIKDERFDYFSLYAPTAVLISFTCVPQVGLFQLQHALRYSFRKALEYCANSTALGTTAALAHVASAVRTEALSALLRDHNTNASLKTQHRQTLAYVNLFSNRSSSSQAFNFYNSDGENLECFLYVAWKPGHPRLNYINCVAITSDKTWMTINCERQLPFICEVYTSRHSAESDSDCKP